MERVAAGVRRLIEQEPCPGHNYKTIQRILRNFGNGKRPSIGRGSLAAARRHGPGRPERGAVIEDPGKRPDQAEKWNRLAGGANHGSRGQAPPVEGLMGKDGGYGVYRGGMPCHQPGLKPRTTLLMEWLWSESWFQPGLKPRTTLFMEWPWSESGFQPGLKPGGASAISSPWFESPCLEVRCYGGNPTGEAGKRTLKGFFAVDSG